MAKKKTQPEPPERAAQLVGPRERGVLVVEDDPESQWRLARLLTVQGHRVVGTSSVEGATALLSTWPVDCVLIAEDLPGALAFATRLRGERSEIPVVLVTTNPAGAKAQALLGTVVDLLVKPLRTEALSELMARVFHPQMMLAPA